MRKPDSLRKLLVGAVPYLTANPDRLQLFVDRGRIAGGGGTTLSFEYRYSLSVVVQDYAGDIDVLMVPVLAWIADNQPELLGKPGAEPFAFETEILDGDTADISITIALTEGVLVTATDTGYSVAAQVPPVIDRFADVPNSVRLWQLFLNGDLVAKTSDPAHQ